MSGSRPDPVSPFRYIGGDPSVDFVDTTDWAVGGLDWFSSYDRIIEWATGAGVIQPRTAESLLATARAQPDAAARVLADSIELRGLLEQLFFDIACGQDATAEIARLNIRWLANYLPQPVVLQSGDGKFALSWPGASDALEAPLWSVIWSASKLLASPDVSRVKRCGGVDGGGIDCGWYYIDRSRNGLRRWCEMETCGTQMKSRRRALRNASLRSAQEIPKRSSPSR